MQAALQAAREAIRATWTVDTQAAQEAIRARSAADMQAALQAAREAIKATWTVDTQAAQEAIRARSAADMQAALQAAREAIKATWTVDTQAAQEAIKARLAADMQAALQAAREAIKATWTVDTQPLLDALKARWRVDHRLFGEAWDERLAAAVGRLEARAEGILAAPPEPELKTVEPLSADMEAVIAAAPAEAREDTKTWLAWLLVFLVDAIAGDPAKEALRHALMKLLVVLLVMVTDPTLPTPPPAPALQQPDALAPVSAPPEALILPGGWQIEGLPDIVVRAGPQAAERTVEFFTAQIRNPHTRAAYGTAVKRFFTWCDARGLELAQISPIAVATYIEEMQSGYRAPTIKQHLAAIRRLFNFLVIGQVVPANPATSVRGPTHVVKTGKTPVLQPAEARLLLNSIDTATLSGLRDRALLGVMVYSFARVSAVVSMRVEDYYQQGKRWWLRLQEKGGKHHAVPVHHKAEAYLDAYLDAAGIAAEKSTPLWRSMPRVGGLGARRMSRVDVFRMIKRRVKAVGLGGANCHTFRATGITAYLLNGGTLERAQRIAAHESPRTTKLYDRTADEVTVEDIEKIGI